MRVWGSLRFVLNSQVPFLALRVCTCTTERVVLARANEFDTAS